MEPIQYLHFSINGAFPWNLLIERIREIEAEATPMDDPHPMESDSKPPEAPDPTIAAILNYLNQRGYQMASYERLGKRIDPNLTPDRLEELIKQNPQVFRSVRLKDGRPGIAKRIP